MGIQFAFNFGRVFSMTKLAVLFCTIILSFSWALPFEKSLQDNGPNLSGHENSEDTEAQGMKDPAIEDPLISVYGDDYAWIYPHSRQKRRTRICFCYFNGVCMSNKHWCNG